MDQKVIDEFWRARARSGRTRWTNDAMLDFDRFVVLPLVSPRAAILDLGSGFGEFSRSLCGPENTLIGVDSEQGMAPGFANDARFKFVHSGVASYQPDRTFDVILLFGVAMYLSVDDEAAVYAMAVRALAPDGVMVVKHQCADIVGFSVDTYSEELGARYSARYPSAPEQRQLLDRFFTDVTSIVYPPELKLRENSTHTAFVCRGPVSRGDLSVN